MVPKWCAEVHWYAARQGQVCLLIFLCQTLLLEQYTHSHLLRKSLTLLLKGASVFCTVARCQIKDCDRQQGGCYEKRTTSCGLRC